MPEMFLKIDGIPGESQDFAHAGEIELQHWEWTTHCNVKWDMNQGGQSTKVDFDAILVQKICDKATVNLYKCCVTGKHIPSATITCRKNDGDTKVEYLIVKLKNIIVKRVTFEGEGEEQRLVEKVELMFAEFNMEYTLQEDSGGGQGATDFGYDIQRMKAA